MIHYGAGYNVYSNDTYNNCRNSYAPRGKYYGDAYTNNKGYGASAPAGTSDTPGVLSSMMSGMKSFFGGCTAEDDVRDADMRHKCEYDTPAAPHTSHNQHVTTTQRHDVTRRDANSCSIPTSQTVQPKVQGDWVGGPPTITPDSRNPLHTVVKCQRETKTKMYDPTKLPLRENHFRGVSDSDYRVL